MTKVVSLVLNYWVSFTQCEAHMGEAKRRKAEIDKLKLLGPRIDPTSSDPEPTAVLARHLHSLFEAAKISGNLDPAVSFIYSKVDATIHSFGQLPIACKKGCSHCCYIWVSATAPELLFTAKIVKNKSDHVIERIRAANQQANEFQCEINAQQP